MVSRVLGLARDMVCAAVFGASGTWAAFIVALKVPNLFRRLFGEGALSASFIPIFSQRFHTEGAISAEKAAQQVVGVHVAVLAGLTVVGEFIIAGLWFVQPAGEDGSLTRGQLALLLSAIMLPHVLSVCTTALLGGMLNVLRNFWIPTLAPIIINVFEIAGVVVAWSLHRAGQLPSLAPVVAAVMVAGVVEVAIPWWALRRRGITIIPRIAWDDPAVRNVIRLMAPAALGLAAVQVNVLADSLIAMWCIPSKGAPVILEYAQRLYQLPLGVIGISVATAIFEQMSAEAAHKQIDSLRNTALEGLKLMLFVGLPISVGMAMVAWPLSSVLFQHGKFTAASANLVAYTSVFYMLGMWAYMSQHVYARGFYALQRPHVPARIATWMVGLNLALNLVLVRFMREAGLALSTAISAYAQIVLLSIAWRRTTGSFAIKGLLVSLLRTSLATGGMAGAIVVIRWLLDIGLASVAQVQPAGVLGRMLAHHQFSNIAHLLASTLVGGVVFWILAHLLGCPETRSLLEGLGRRRARAKDRAAAQATAAPAAEAVSAGTAK